MISIIVPVYNLEEYLPQCLESIINQSYSDLQIILVDDGSADGSGKICDDFAAKDPRITVIHKPNGGVSAARNDGLAIAKGEYVGFVDGDDVIDSDMYSVLLEKAESFHADLTVCSYITRTAAAEIRKNADSFYTADFRAEPERFVYLYNNYLLNALWNKLFRRDLIKSGFPVGVKMGEDLMFVLRYMEGCKSVCMTDECLYKYTIRGTSATASFQPQRVDTVIRLYRVLERFCKTFDTGEVDCSIYFANLKKLDAAFSDVMLHRLQRHEIICVIDSWCGNPTLHKFLDKYGSSQEMPYKLICSSDAKAVYGYLKRRSVLPRFRITARNAVGRLLGR